MPYEIRRIRQTEAEAVTDLWDEAGQSVADGGRLKERGRRNIAAMLVLAASHPSTASFVAVADKPIGLVMAELDEGLLPGRGGTVSELYARGDLAIERALAEAATEWLSDRGACVVRFDVPLGEPGGDLLEALGFEPETVRYGLYPSGGCDAGQLRLGGEAADRRRGLPPSL